MVTRTPLNDTDLDEFFAAAQGASVPPSDDFMARILSDAMAEMPEAAGVVAAGGAAAQADQPRRGLIGALLAAIGGWPAAAGLATATMAGLAVGFVTPDTLDELTGGYLEASYGYQVEDFLPSYGNLLIEG